MNILEKIQLVGEELDIINNGATAQRGDKMSISTGTPEDSKIVHTCIYKAMRFKHYKKGSQESKKGIIGRWQEFNGYGWNNCEEPDQWSYDKEGLK